MKNRFNRLISLQNASKQYKKHESTLRTLIERGKFIEEIDCKKYGKTWVFNQDALDRFYGINKKGDFIVEINSYIEKHKEFFNSESKVGLFKLGALIENVRDNLTENQFEPFENILADATNNDCNNTADYIMKHVYTKLMKLIIQYDLGCENILEEISDIMMKTQFKLPEGDTNYILYIYIGINIYKEVN